MPKQRIALRNAIHIQRPGTFITIYGHQFKVQPDNQLVAEIDECFTKEKIKTGEFILLKDEPKPEPETEHEHTLKFKPETDLPPKPKPKPKSKPIPKLKTFENPKTALDELNAMDEILNKKKEDK